MLKTLWSIALITAGALGAANTLAQPQQGPDPAFIQAEIERMIANSRLPDTPGSGPYPAIKEVVESHPDHVIYRPKNVTAVTDSMPVLVFGNGGCSDDGASARLFLSEIASHGYLVIAPGAIRNGPGAPPLPENFPLPDPSAPPPTQAGQLLESLDWAAQENLRPDSPLHNKIDTTRMAASGYSCGGLQALQIADDPRLSTVIVLNSGLFVAEDTVAAGSMKSSKAWLGSLATPTLYLLGGRSDIAYENGMDDFRRINHVPVFVGNLEVGHSGTYWEPNGGAWAEVVVDWLDWHLRGDPAAAKTFQGADCRLCIDPKWTIEKKQADDEARS